MYGLHTTPTPTVNTTKWFCSQLIGFVLQQANLIDKTIDPSKISVTDLFFICSKAGWKPCHKSPFSRTTTTTESSSLIVPGTVFNPEFVYFHVTGKQIQPLSDSEIKNFR
jgi:hypothetical protein